MRKLMSLKETMEALLAGKRICLEGSDERVFHLGSDGELEDQDGYLPEDVDLVCTYATLAPPSVDEKLQRIADALENSDDARGAMDEIEAILADE